MFTLKSKNAGRVDLIIEGQTVAMIVDTGASCIIINHDVWTKVNKSTNGKLQLKNCKHHLYIWFKYSNENFGMSKVGTGKSG